MVPATLERVGSRIGEEPVRVRSGRLVWASLTPRAQEDGPVRPTQGGYRRDLRLHATGMGVGAVVESVELIRRRGTPLLYQLYLLLNRHKSR
jgi:hypothetical protein